MVCYSLCCVYMYGCECGVHMCACVYVCVHESMCGVCVYLCVQVCMCVEGIFSAGGGQNLLVYCILGGHDL